MGGYGICQSMLANWSADQDDVNSGPAGGGTSFFRVLVATVVLGVLWTLVGQVTVLGQRPQPVPGSVTWSVVWSSGSLGTLHE